MPIDSEICTILDILLRFGHRLCNPGFLMQEYILAFGDKTTGLDTIGPDINAYNSYGMTPLQVALQAGAVGEARAILAHPDIDRAKPSKAGANPEFFIQLHERNSGQSGSILREILGSATENVQNGDKTMAGTDQNAGLDGVEPITSNFMNCALDVIEGASGMIEPVEPGQTPSMNVDQASDFARRAIPVMCGPVPKGP